ncbi:putative sigma-54 modulation protein [Megasphaera cerevisiae DSM 20462]|nr:putative sigma-54 modulation protein [Megasphaera cerevisiae DSM 20462]
MGPYISPVELPHERKGCFMATIVRGKNLEITTALKDYVLKREKKVTKYFDNEVGVQALLSVEKDRKVAEITLKVDGVVLRGVEANQDMYAAIDLVYDKMVRQIHKYKTKIARRMKDSSFNAALVNDSAEPEEKFEIARVKKFAARPMDVEEAILQMNLVGHDFFVFLNAETDTINVVYKRKHGQYGLIEPEY